MATQSEPVCIIILLILIVSQSVLTCPSECQSCKGGAVRCPGIGLRQPPPSMTDDTVLVDLTGNDITSLNLNSFAGLSNVQSLRLPGNKLTSLEALAFKDMPSLMSLDLSQNQIALIDDKAFSGLQELLTLSLTGNQLMSIGGVLYELPMLHNLRLMNNMIGSIGKDDFKNNEQLKMLDMSNNKISTIHSEAFAKLKMLRYLILTSNPIVSVPDLTFTTDMLQLVDFSNCILQAVPKTMPSCVGDFRLGFNEISELKVVDFKGMTNLRLLTINDNKIGNIEHRTFWNLTNLKEIWLTRNQMVYIPRGIPANVEKLYMDSNMVFELEHMLFPVDSKLELLTLEMNTIRRVDPESLKELRNLKDLNLQGNQISKIEANTFNNLPYLENLKLTQNPIQTIENKAFNVLPNLTTLAMAQVYPLEDGPQILQENILAAMPRLETLDLSTSHYLAESLLKIISSPDTQPIPSIKIIKLQYSDLKTLTANVRQVFPSTTSIFLDGNMWSCDIHLMWLRDWMQEETVQFYTYEEPVCHSPQHLMGQTIKSLKDSDFSEPESKNFPKEIEMTPVKLPPVPEETATDVADSPVHTVKESKQETGKPYKATRVVIRGPKKIDNPTKQSSDISQVIPDTKVVDASKAQSDKSENQKQNKKRKGKKKKNREKRQKSGKTSGQRKRRIGKKERRCKLDENGNLSCQKRQEKKEKINSDSITGKNKGKNI